MNCAVMKSGRKWAVVINGNTIYTATTRVACFRWAVENGYKVAQYQHGGT